MNFVKPLTASLYLLSPEPAKAEELDILKILDEITTTISTQVDGSMTGCSFRLTMGRFATEGKDQRRISLDFDGAGCAPEVLDGTIQIPEGTIANFRRTVDERLVGTAIKIDNALGNETCFRIEIVRNNHPKNLQRGQKFTVIPCEKPATGRDHTSL